MFRFAEGVRPTGAAHDFGFAPHIVAILVISSVVLDEAPRANAATFDVRGMSNLCAVMERWD